MQSFDVIIFFPLISTFTNNLSFSKVFSRSLAKTETFGVGFMDIGIASFIVSSALTSRHARNWTKNNLEKDQPVYKIGAVFLSASTLQKIAVLILGFGRLVTLRILDYQSHDTEYGTEWNFFVTLFFLWLLADIVHHIFSRLQIILFSLFLLLGYQYALTEWGVTEYILNAPRSSFFSSNREGILSLFGCLPLYLLSEEFSYYVFFRRSDGLSTNSKLNSKELCFDNDVCFTNKSSPTRPSSTKLSSKDHKNTENVNEGDRVNAFKNDRNFGILWRLTLSGAVLFVCWCGAEYIQPTSRRLFNLSFVLLNFLITVVGLLFLVFAERYLFLNNGSIYGLELFNKHQLAVFLVANILTGVVNMTFRTIHCPTSLSMLILSVYIFIVHSLPWMMERMLRATQANN